MSDQPLLATCTSSPSFPLMPPCFGILSEDLAEGIRTRYMEGMSTSLHTEDPMSSRSAGKHTPLLTTVGRLCPPDTPKDKPPIPADLTSLGKKVFANTVKGGLLR